MYWEEYVKFIDFEYLTDYLIGLYLISFLVQLMYIFYFFARLAFYKKSNKNADLQPVSVIICAKNERDNLLEYLPLFFKQDYPNFEIIVVNDHSLDDTEEVLKAFALQYKKLKVVNVPDTDRFYGSKKFALTLGIKAAKFDCVLLTDADCKPASKDWIKLMSSYQKDKKIILGVGLYQKERGLLNKLIRFETFYTALQYLSFALAKKPYMGVGRNLAYHTKLFYNNKGFATHQHILSGDDDLFINDVANKQNTQVVIDNDAFTYSKPKITYNEWIRQKKRHYTTGKYYKLRHKIWLGGLLISQYIFIVLFFGLVITITPFHLILGIFLVRLLIQMLIFKLSSNKIGGKDLMLFLPLFELFFMIFNPLIVISNFISRKIKWN